MSEPNMVTEAIDQHVSMIANLLKNQDPYFAVAGMNYLFRELAWALVETTDIGEHTISEQMEGMAKIILEPRSAAASEG